MFELFLVWVAFRILVLLSQANELKKKEGEDNE